MSNPGQKAILILGCGYFGKMLAQKLAFSGRFVAGTVRRDVELSVVRTRGAEPLIFDGEDYTELERYRGRIGAVVQSIPPTDLEAERVLVERLHGWGAEQALYISSTSVYGDHAGAQVTETSACTPDSPKGRMRLEAEKIWLDSPLPAAVLRPSGIYGPLRSLLHRVAAGRSRLIGDGEALTNRIHVADLASIAAAALKSPVPGAIWLGTDGAACTQREVADWIGANFPFRPPTQMSLDEARVRMDKDAFTISVQSKRLDPTETLTRLQVKLQFPDYRAGLKAIWVRERVALETLAREHGQLLEAV